MNKLPVLKLFRLHGFSTNLWELNIHLILMWCFLSWRVATPSTRDAVSKSRSAASRLLCIRRGLVRRGRLLEHRGGAGLLRVAQLPQVRWLVRVHPRDRRTEPRHKGAARFHVPRLCCSQTRPNSPPRVFDRRKSIKWQQLPKQLPQQLPQKLPAPRGGLRPTTDKPLQMTVALLQRGAELWPCYGKLTQSELGVGLYWRDSWVKHHANMRTTLDVNFQKWGHT